VALHHILVVHDSPAVRETVGILHMVGCLGTHTGRGLGALVCLAALYQMRTEQRAAAVLSTADFRLPAIRTYARLGFAPLLFSADHRRRWRAVAASLPVVPAGWDAVLDGRLSDLPVAG
jgi:mycothiol synthase